jgi:poly(hydroxyalkanoate) depolymerase family esterase
MHNDLQRLMQEATRLTRQGDLHAATQVIQQTLGRHGAGASASEGAQNGAMVIDVEARFVPGLDEAATALPRPAHVQDLPGEPVSPPTAQPEQFITGHHGGPGLSGRAYKLYLPPLPSTEPASLVVMLHGCTQGPDDFARGTRMNELARARGVYVLYPEQAQKANAQRCWNWFKHNHQARGRGEAALLAGMASEVARLHGIDPGRVFVAGLSAGGAMAAVLAAEYPDVFAAAGVHSGLAAGAASDLPAALQAMKSGARGAVKPLAVPVIVFHGDADGTVTAANGEQVVQAATGGAMSASEEPLRTLSRRAFKRRVHRDAQGRVRAEHWLVHGAPHAWSGGSAAGSYTDPQGPDASAQMLRFFREHARG